MGVVGTRGTLFDADDSVLVLVDVQPGFLRRLDRPVAEQVVEHICLLVRTARALGVPIVVTEEEAAVHGATEPSVAAALPPDHVRHDKGTFGLAASPAILAEVTATRRRSAVLVGLETDVCVAQSAIGLLDLGWKVAVVADAVAAPGSGHGHGVERMRQAGITLTGAKGLFYEWVRSLDRLAGLDLPAPPSQ